MLYDEIPFKFGIDSSGNYGYYKVGADSVTPFLNITGSLSLMGFLNVPSGNWVLKTGTKTLTAKNANIIPICIRISNGGGNLGRQSDGQGWYNAYNNYGLHVEAYMVDGGDGHQYGGARGSADNIFLPSLQGMDLTKVQNTYTRGTFTVWLEK